jgi:Flp pilus assembly protein TadG
MDGSRDSRPRPEQSFFAGPVLDRVLGMVMALSAEVWVLRETQRRMALALERAGLAADAEPTPEEAAAIARDRDAFAAALLENLLGRQASRGAP